MLVSLEKNLWRHNFLLVACYSLKFTQCLLLVLKSHVTLSKMRSLLLLAAEVACCKKSLVTRCQIRQSLVAEVACCKKSLVTRCQVRQSLVAEVARCKKSLVARGKIPSLLVAEVPRCEKSLVTCCKNLLFIKNYSLLVAKFDPYLLHTFTKNSQLNLVMDDKI